MKFGCDWRKISHKSKCKKDSERTFLLQYAKNRIHPCLRRILELLKNGRLSAGEIGSHFDMAGATISYHLGILKKADLVLESREKNFIYYELNTSVLEEIMLWISELKGGTSDVEKI